ncbi:Aldo/keto reductase [Mycena sp. CBHHK59/15]|nr:Aldo/keto reductase [Mycena sp. CBHHK59/15]
MGILSHYEAVESDDERFKVLDSAHQLGCTFWDTADLYAIPVDNRKIMFKRTGKRDEIFLCSKFGVILSTYQIDGRLEYVKKAVESLLKKLGVDCIDLYYLHRVDQQTPIEHTVSATAEFVKAGKIKYFGLSEVSAATLRCAHAIHPISAMQFEYSPFSLNIKDPKIGLLATACELGGKVVTYSPLGRRLLTGQYVYDFEDGDFRKTVRFFFSAANFPNILKLADGLKSVGEKYGGATAGQVALTWLLAQGDDIIPIPGTKKIKYLEENITAGKLTLSPEDVQARTGNLQRKSRNTRVRHI